MISISSSVLRWFLLELALCTSAAVSAQKLGDKTQDFKLPETPERIEFVFKGSLRACRANLARDSDDGEENELTSFAAAEKLTDAERLISMEFCLAYMHGRRDQKGL